MVIPCDFTQICRLCLVKDKVNVFLFDNNDTTKSILEKINSCLPVTVSENDNLPKKICDICLEKLNATYAFQNTTLNSEKQLLTWLAESSSKSASSINDVAIEVLPDTSIVKEEAPDPDIVNELNEELHSQIEETEEPVPKRPRRSTALNRPVIEPDTEEDEDVDDVEPISKFESEDEDLEKLDIPSYLDPTTLADQPGPSGVGKESGEPTPISRSVLKSLSQNQIDEAMKAGLLLFKTNSECYLMEPQELEKVNNLKEYKDLVKLIKENVSNDKNHDETYTEKKKKSAIKKRNKYHITIEDCEVCGKKVLKKNMKRHVEAHRGLRTFECTYCGKCFRFDRSLKVHEESHQNKTFPCLICQKVYPTSKGLENHLKRHTMPQKHKCDKCEKAFKYKSNLKIHLEQKHPAREEEKNNLCDICGKNFHSVQYLNWHHKHIHVNEDGIKREYKCEICGNIYTTELRLKIHIRRQHKHKKLFVCEFCGKQLASKGSHDKHVNIHKGIEPVKKHKCDYCEKRFADVSTFKAHVRIHTGEKPYKCPVCEKAFTQSSSMKIHLRIHSDNH